MVEGYDAADPERASTLALREEWMDGGHSPQARVVGGYGAMIDFLASRVPQAWRDVSLRLRGVGDRGGRAARSPSAVSAATCMAAIA